MKEQKIKFYELGNITESTNQKTVAYKNKFLNLADYTLKARDYEDVKEYLKKMMKWIEKSREIR